MPPFEEGTSLGEREMQNRKSKMNIDVYAEDGWLNVRFDIVAQSDVEKDILMLSNLRDVAAKVVKKPLERNDLYDDDELICDKNIMSHILQISQNEPDKMDSFEATHTKTISNNAINHVIINYKISNIPHVVLNWLACFSMFINYYADSIEHIQIGDHSCFQNVNRDTMNDIFSLKNEMGKCLRYVMQAMIQCKASLERYQEAFIALEKIYKIYVDSRESTHPKSFLQFLSDNFRYDVLYSPQRKGVNTETLENKELDILSLTLADEPMARKIEFLFMLDIGNSKNKILLLKPCLGEKAHDKGLYDMNYTELMLIYCGEFYRFPDGRIGIVNLHKNPAYMKYYADGQINHSILKDELLYLANLLCWELEPDCDPHKENTIMFTKAFSLKLAEHGLHLNSSYSKELMVAHHLLTLFTYIRLADNNYFSLLPTDIMDDILVMANPALARMYDKKTHPGFFQAAQLAKANGEENYKCIDRHAFSRGNC